MPIFRAGVTVPAAEPLSAVFDGQHRQFEWREKGIKVLLPEHTSIHTFTIHQISLPSDQLKLPSSVCCCSQVYELSCTHTEPTSTLVVPDTSAEVTVPYRQELGSRHSFFLAKRTPQWQCDLSPLYMFTDTKSGRFDAGQSSLSLQDFNCLLCVCFQSSGH